MFALLARDVRKNESRWGLIDPEELEDELHTACASRDQFEEVELRDLNLMRLPSCVMALTVPKIEYRETVLVFVRQTTRNLLLPSDHFFVPSRFWMLLGLGQKPRGPKASCDRNGG